MNNNEDLLNTLKIVQGMFDQGEVEALGADPDTVKERIGEAMFRGAVGGDGSTYKSIERSSGPCALAENVEVYPEPEADSRSRFTSTYRHSKIQPEIWG